MAAFEDLIQRGTRGAQPVATVVKVGALYYVTDESILERSTGAAWQSYSSGAGAGTVTHTGGALTASQLVIGAGTDDVAALGSLGTTTTLLHGNAAGAPTFGAVSLSADVTGTLAAASLGTTGTPQFGRVGINVAADSSAKLKVAGQYGSTTVAAGNSGASKTLDWDDGNTQLLTMTASCTLTLSNPKDGFRYLIVLLQGGSGSYTMTWPSAVKWSAGTAPTLSTAVGKADIVTLVWVAGIGASGNYLAAANTDYTPA